MSEYGAEFDRKAETWRVIENEHDREHPDRGDCGGAGGCTMMRVGHRLEAEMIDALHVWRSRGGDGAVTTQPHVPQRGSDVEAWIKRERDSREASNGGWLTLDFLLDDYRDHADAGAPLDQDIKGPRREED